VTVGASFLVCASLLGVVASHVVLTEGQIDLDRMRQQASDEAARNARLRLEVAQLESPAWVTAAARGLGMEEATRVTYLQVSGTPRPKAKG
jgi:cell division protein FtsL